MLRPIVHDGLILARKSEPASKADESIARDLTDTLLAHREECVGMAANMIGVCKRIIVFFNGNAAEIMFNPEILQKTDPYPAEEGCLSLAGKRKTTRYRMIRVQYQTADMRTHIDVYYGYTAQIIQHEIDHCDGVLI